MNPSQLQASLVGETVEVSGVVEGQKAGRAVPVSTKFECQRCGELLTQEAEGSILTRLLNGADAENPATFDLMVCPGCERNGPLAFVDATWTDLATLYLRPLLEDLEMETFTAEAAKSKTVHLLGQTAPEAKKVAVKGKVKVEGKRKELYVVAEEAEAYEDALDGFSITQEDRENFGKWFGDGVGTWRQIAPHIVERDLAKKAAVLALHTPARIPDAGKREIRGTLNTMFFGDTKTGKSDIIQDICKEMGLGEYLTAETASRTGITYSIDPERDILKWGVLPLNDRRLVGMDGLDCLHSNEMKQLREVLRSQRVTVKRSKTGEALARTRVIAAMNPSEDDMEGCYLRACEGLKDSWIFNHAPNITRWDVILPFASGDVSVKAITDAGEGDRPVPEHIFKRHVYWVWSREPEHVDYSEEARTSIKQESRRLIEGYHLGGLPIVHSGYREVLSRLSVATAALNHSTDTDHEKILVGKRHVEDAVEFIEEVLEMLEIRGLKEVEEAKRKVGQDEFEEIVDVLENRELQILGPLLSEGKHTKDEFADAVGVSTSTVERSYKNLREFGLIETQPGRGAVRSERGVNFLKRYAKHFPSKFEGMMGGKNTPPSKQKGLTEKGATEDQGDSEIEGGIENPPIIPSKNEGSDTESIHGKAGLFRQLSEPSDLSGFLKCFDCGEEIQNHKQEIGLHVHQHAKEDPEAAGDSWLWMNLRAVEVAGVKP